MDGVDIDNLTIEQYLRLTQESQTPKKIEDMTIAEYLEYEKNKGEENHLSNTKFIIFLSISANVPNQTQFGTVDHYFGPNQLGAESDCDSEDMEEEVEYMTDDEVVMSEQEESNHGYTQNIQHFEEKDDVNEWLNAEITKHMSMQGVKKMKDALISIIKSIRQEMKDGIIKRQFEASTTSVSDEVSSIPSNEVDRADDNTPNTTPCRIGHNNLHESDREFIFNEWILDSYDVKEEYAREIGNPYSKRFDEYNRVFNNEIEHLSNEYFLRIGKKGYVLDDVWGKCQQNYKKTNEAWHDEGYEEDEMCRSGDEKTDYDPPLSLPLGRVNGARFKAMIRKELEGNKLTQESQTPKKIKDMTIAEYLEYEKKSDCDSEDMEEEVEYTTHDEIVTSEQEESNHGYTQNIQHFEEKDDVDEWLKAEITKHMSMLGVENMKDALISIIKSIRQEMKDGIMKRQFEASTTSVSDEVSSIASLEVDRVDDNSLNNAPYDKDNIMPQRVYEYLGLDKLRDTSTLENTTGTNEPLGTINILVKFEELEFPYCGMWQTCDPDSKFCFGYNEVFWVNEHGTLRQWICFRDHERRAVKWSYMGFADFLQVRYEQQKSMIQHGKEGITNGIGHNNLHESDCEFIFNKWILDSYDVKEEYAREIGNPYSKRFDKYNRVFNNEIKHVSNEYILRIGKKGYVLDDVWEKCQQNYKKTNEAWHDEGYEEDEMWRSGEEKTDYNPPYVNIKTFEVKNILLKEDIVLYAFLIVRTKPYH
ncbi:hypothetical protein Tco_0860873 [Tanacetum coccineum]|uniref:Uncharacterized protein n=1 Tax=Tanacetum coccineum TaxID=301880 RepID=A0ABQ5BJK5_9ASTR